MITLSAILICDMKSSNGWLPAISDRSGRRCSGISTRAVGKLEEDGTVPAFNLVTADAVLNPSGIELEDLIAM